MYFLVISAVLSLFCHHCFSCYKTKSRLHTPISTVVRTEVICALTILLAFFSAIVYDPRSLDSGTCLNSKPLAHFTVDHAALLNKLSTLGILDKAHGWFADYLSNRTQVVEFQGVTSTPEAIFVGVPQGSILGPLLFIQHITDSPEVVSECSILMYTDDTVLYCSSSKASVIQDKLIADLSKIEHWLSFNSLFIKVTKTEAMLFETAP